MTLFVPIFALLGPDKIIKCVCLFFHRTLIEVGQSVLKVTLQCVAYPSLTASVEFAGLWKYISDWQNVFRHFDRDRSGSIEGRELAEALHSFGYNLSPQLLQLIESKYGTYWLL